MAAQVLKVLEVAASARATGSVSRQLSAELIDALRSGHTEVDLKRRDLADGIPFVDADWIEANFTPEAERHTEHRAALITSDAMVAELQAADVLVIGVPVHNFSIPAALKAWIDMVARARLTFRYTENGPQGLLKNKKAYLVVASGGVRVGSPADFATPYLRHALSFIGIDDVEIVAADRLNSDADSAMRRARAAIEALAAAATQAA